MVRQYGFHFAVIQEYHKVCRSWFMLSWWPPVTYGYISEQMLKWPEELAQAATGEPRWSQAGSNLCLDFHGDPLRAKLVMFSDGNHHMALAETLQAFVHRYPDVGDIFYMTTPPAVLLRLLETGGLFVGNLHLSVAPHVMISPPPILDRAVATGRMQKHRPFMRSLGNVLLVRKGNPKSIRSIADLARPDVKLFLSNPVTETASYQVYSDSLKALAGRINLELDIFPDPPKDSERVVYGERIHHREAPQSLADGQVDAAFLYYHLALRYTRIFPECFEIVPVDGTPVAPAAENVISHFHAAMVDDGGQWGKQLLDFLFSVDVEKIYRHHGLCRP
jgi:hypothetical protein